MHHIVTIALVTTSTEHNYMSTGVMVLLVHDSSDVILDLMKMANYLKLEGWRGCFAVRNSFHRQYIPRVAVPTAVFTSHMPSYTKGGIPPIPATQFLNGISSL